MRIIAALALLVACREPYRESLTVMRMGDRWAVRFWSNGSTNTMHIVQAIDWRARQICRGEYILVQSAGGPQSSAYTNRGNGMTYTNQWTDTTAMIQCK